MLCIKIDNKNPYFCLAAEQYLMHNFSEDIMMLWQSENTVVVGKHQIAQAEVNVPFIHKKNVNVARRISGGGTVFHDKGNINFTFIKSVENTASIRFKDFSKLIIEPLHLLGVDAYDNKTNDILVDGKKISGSSEHIYKKRVMHHGTLLFNADLKKLGNSLSKDDSKYKSRAVASNRSTVANIADYLQKQITTNEFFDFLFRHFLQKENHKEYQLTEEDIKQITNLENTKFSTEEWIWGYAPKYQFTNLFKDKEKSLQINFSVEKGLITTSNIRGNLWSQQKIDDVNHRLIEKKHLYNEISDIIDNEIIVDFFF